MAAIAPAQPGRARSIGAILPAPHRGKRTNEQGRGTAVGERAEGRRRVGRAAARTMRSTGFETASGLGGRGGGSVPARRMWEKGPWSFISTVVLRPTDSSRTRTGETACARARAQARVRVVRTRGASAGAGAGAAGASAGVEAAARVAEDARGVPCTPHLPVHFSDGDRMEAQLLAARGGDVVGPVDDALVLVSGVRVARAVPRPRHRRLGAVYKREGGEERLLLLSESVFSRGEPFTRSKILLFTAQWWRPVPARAMCLSRWPTKHPSPSLRRSCP
jgi:hypothetical protein